MKRALLHHSILYTSALLDCILGAHIPFIALFTIHVAVFRYGISFNLAILSILGLFFDAYTSRFLGLQSLFFICAFWLFQKTALWTKKTENFWYVWLSFSAIALFFYSIDHSIRFECSLFSREALFNPTFLLSCVLISIHPLFFQILLNQEKKIRW